MRHVISALVINESGVLANVAGMFAARGFNIDSLVVGRTENSELSRMTIVCTADDNTIEQVRKQLAKLVPVVKVRDFKDAAYVERDLLLVKVSANADKRGEVIEIVNMFRGNVVDVAIDSLMIELIGTEEKLEAFIELMKVYGIEEVARTGVIAMARGAQSSKERRPPSRARSAPAASTPPPPPPYRRRKMAALPSGTGYQPVVPVRRQTSAGSLSKSVAIELALRPCFIASRCR